MHIIDILFCILFLLCILFYILNCILYMLYILHIVHIEHIYLHIASGYAPSYAPGNTYHAYFLTNYAYYFTYLLTCLFPLLLGPPSKGPAVHVPPPTAIATVLISVTRSSRKVWWFSSDVIGYHPLSPTGATGRRPSMELTGMTYNTCACSLRS